MLLALVLAQAVSPIGNPAGPILSQPSLMNRSPLLEAFPTSGVGTSGVCSTTAPTGTKGEALTFSRASSATCTKTASSGYATTGIADGDLVVLSSNQPRVEYGADGLLGLLLEASRTNSCLRSEAMDNASWSKTGTGVAAPTVTADYATAPDGTMTADRVQFAACPAAGNQSILNQNTSVAVAAARQSFYVRGTSGSGSISVCQFASVDGTCTACNFVSTSWTRCVNSGAGPHIVIGCNNETGFYSGASNTGAADVLVWGAQHEEGATLTSYIPTAGAAVVRAGEGTPTFPFVAASGSTVAIATTVTTNFIPTTGTTLATPPGSGNPSLLGRFSGGNFGCYQMTPAADLAAGTWAVGQNRWACSTARMAHLRGTSATASASTITATLSTIGFGSTGGFGVAIDGIYTNLCGDVGNYTRCAP